MSPYFSAYFYCSACACKRSGVVDLDEFLGLYSRVKSGGVDGLAGYTVFEKPKRNRAASAAVATK